MPPSWQALVNDNQFTNPEFPFFITPFVDDASADGGEEPGGVFTLAEQTVPFSMATPTFSPSHPHRLVAYFDYRPCPVSDELRVFRGTSI